jgi:hypothetical protein
VRVAGLSEIVVVSPPDKTDYFTGEDLELNGLAVKGIWEDVAEKPVTITQESLSSYDKNRAGKQNVFVTYQGKTTSFPVTFVSMQSITISRPPAKLNYENGEKELDLEGLTVQGTRTGATSVELVDISRLQISGYDRFKTGNQTVTITIGGKSSTFRVTVGPSPFVGTWQGTDTTPDGQDYPVTAVLSEDSYTVSWPKAGIFFAGEYGGTYTRDRDTGKQATTQETKSKYREITAIELISPTELKVTSRLLNNGKGVILTKVR